jgi:hypothetical protein
LAVFEAGSGQVLLRADWAQGLWGRSGAEGCGEERAEAPTGSPDADTQASPGTKQVRSATAPHVALAHHCFPTQPVMQVWRVAPCS